MSDTIDRQAAIDAFKKELTVGESKGNYVTICSAVGYIGAKQILESLPSAQPQRMRGRWIKSETDGFLCSVCHIGYKTQPTLMGNPMFEFCPCCGADMRGTE